jgi:hypothetical protein
VVLRALGFSFALALISYIGLAVPLISQTGHEQRVHVSLTDLCVTEGTITALPAHRLLVTDPNVHATMNRETPQDIEAHFVYLGPSDDSDTPSSGQNHHRFGFELFAQDACNLAYVMWRLEPESNISVFVKSNSEQHIHAECGRRGTITIEPEHRLPLPPVRAGERISHTLHAEITGSRLLVFADGTLVWRGALPSEILRTHGPVGIHCDNAKLEIMLTVAPPVAGAPVLPCKAAPESD